MSYQLLFHPEAEREYIAAYLWYETAQQGLGERFEKIVEQCLHQISLYPENYHFGKAPYGEVVTEIFPYSIVYKLNKRKKLIYITAVYHSKRNPKNKYRK